MSWGQTQLGNLVSISKGKKHAPALNGIHRYINIEDLHRDNNPQFTNEKGVLCNPNDLIIAWDGANAGKVGVGYEGVIGSTLARLLIKNTNVDAKFLFWFLESKNETIKSQRTGATIPHINGSSLKELQIPLPPLHIQKRIAEILDAADALKRKDQELLKKYDELAQAIFIDMFGDPVKNEKGWEDVEIIDCCYRNDDIRCGPFGTQLLQSEFVKEGIPLWGIKHVNSGFKKMTDEFLTISKAQILKNYTISKGDIVMTRKGTIGNCSVYKFDHDGIMHSDILRIRVNENIINPLYLSYQLKHSQGIDNQLAQISQGAIMSGINVSKLKLLKIIKPPIYLQDKFEEILLNIELNIINIEKMQSSILFNALIQKAFTGKLVY